MRVTRARFVIAVPDLLSSAAFYRDVLGFEVHEIGDDGFRIYKSGACEIFAGECRDALPPAATGDHSYFAYLVIDDVDAMHARVAGKCEIVKAMRDEPWGMREFGLRTSDGHRLMFAQPLP